MKHLRILAILLLAAMFALTACSEDDDNPVNNNNEGGAPSLSDNVDMTFAFNTDVTGLTATDVDYDGVTTTGYSLDQFVPLTDLGLDAEELVEYNFQIVAEDGYTSRTSSFTTWDLTWEQFESGYYLSEIAAPRIYFPSDDIVSGYNVKGPSYVNMYRTIMVTGDDGLVTPFEVSQYEVSDVSYFEHDDDPEMGTYSGFAITNIITEYVTDAPADFSYIFVTSDGWVNTDSNNTFDWATMQKGWWIPEKNRVVFVGDDGYQLFKAVKAVVGVTLNQ